MTKYEYRIFRINTQTLQEDSDNFLEDILNNEGEKGWKLIQVIEEKFGMYTKHSYYFIREKQK